MPENDDLKTSIRSDKQNINYNENKILIVRGKKPLVTMTAGHTHTNIQCPNYRDHSMFHMHTDHM